MQLAYNVNEKWYNFITITTKLMIVVEISNRNNEICIAVFPCNRHVGFFIAECTHSIPLSLVEKYYEGKAKIRPKQF